MHPNAHPAVEITIIAVYLALMLAVGFAFRRFNRDTSDYFRSGSRATWWLVGTSAFMSGFSAWTFTGAAGAIYQNGWSILAIFLGNAFGFLLNALFFGPWARQMRTTTSPEALQLRFNEPTRAFYALLGVLLSLLYSALQLYGLALFSSSVFGLPLRPLMIVLGVVVLLYATWGGSWAIMATDFLQGVILVPITALLAILCLAETGGIGGFFQRIDAAGLTTSYALVKDAGTTLGGSFTLGWFAAMFIQASVGLNTLGSANRYFAVKDGRAARQAAALGCVLFLLGSFFWFVPPITARLLFSAQVAAMPFPQPEETAYAVASFSLLPPGLVGVMVVAIFAATMSSMGPALNGNAAVVICDLHPILRRLRGLPPGNIGPMLGASRLTTVVLGVAIVGIALYFARAGGVGLFQAMIDIGAMLAIPLAVPLLWCLFLRRSPVWAALASAAATLVVSAIGFFSEALFGSAWTFQTRVFTNLAVGSAAYLLTLTAWRSATPAYRAKVDAFFTRMHTPVDFEREIGEASDDRQLRFIGLFALGIGALVLALNVLPHSPRHHAAITAVGGVIAGLGVLMWRLGRRSAVPEPIEKTTD